MKRIWSAVFLFCLAPLVAEFLLGDLPISMLGALVVLAPMYGGGALLIREVARRTGGGWPRIFMLALAYALFEEAFTTQTLFNPNYLHLNLHLLAPAYVAALGVGVWWTMNVLTLHTVWSISVSIALAEALFPEAENAPWLGGAGLGISALLFLLGAAGSTAITLKEDPYLASRAQFTAAAAVCALIVILAFRLPRLVPARASWFAPRPWLAGAAALAAGSIFLVIPRQWAWVAVALYALLDLTMTVAILRWSCAANWGGLHRLALAGGAALAYAWHAFIQVPAVGKTNRIGNAVFAVGLIALLTVATRGRIADRQKVA